MGFHRQEFWSGLLFPSPGDFSDRGIKPVSPALAGRFFTTEPPGKPCVCIFKLNGFFLAVLGLCGCTGFSLVAESRSYSLAVVHGLAALAVLDAEHRL